ncbi:hypothetical protein EGT36_07410 [Agrobacterium sp. FDAARGOS_525]|nr:hypothetical protein EGT36_07410 [Agrobacterium sp. FDAARGOS_525]
MGCGHVWTSRFSATGAGSLSSSSLPVTAKPARTLPLGGDTPHVIEALNSKLKRAARTTSHFPNDDATMKLP